MWYIKQYTKTVPKYYSKNKTWKPKPTAKYRGQRVGFCISLESFSTQEAGLDFVEQNLANTKNKVVCVNGVVD